MAEGMQSTLDRMTQGITATKNAAGAGLTPVGTEKGGPLDGKHEVAFPYDDVQTIQNAIKVALKHVSDAKAELDHVGQGLIALATLYGLDPDKAPAPVPARESKAAERFAGSDPEAPEVAPEDFDKSYAAKQAAAQAATFAAADAPPADEGWTCPEHGSSNIVVGTTRKGRPYRKCTAPTCGRFEKKEVTS